MPVFKSNINFFNPLLLRPVHHFSIAAYGAFIIPSVFGQQFENGTPEYALYGFAVYSLICLGLNWWFYQGPKAEVKNP